MLNRIQFMIQYIIQLYEAVANVLIKFIFNLMKTQINLEFATGILDLIVKTRMEFTQEFYSILRKQIFKSSPMTQTQQLLKFLRNFKGNSAQSIRQKIKLFTKRTNYNIRLTFKLLEKKNGKQIGFQSWNIMFQKMTVEYTQILDSQNYCDLLNGIFELGQQLPLFQGYLNRDASRFKKKRYFLNFKIECNTDNPYTSGFGICITEFKGNFFKIKSIVTYTSIEIEKQVPIFNGRIKKVFSQKRESEKLTKKLSTDQSQRSFDSKRSLKTKSFFQYYDNELDVTFLSNGQSDFNQNGSLATKVIYEDDNPSSSEYEMIVNDQQEKIQEFRELLLNLKQKFLDGQQQKQYFI